METDSYNLLAALQKMSGQRVHARSLSGGPITVEGPLYASAAEFVQRSGGTMAIDKILIANNGIAV